MTTEKNNIKKSKKNPKKQKDRKKRTPLAYISMAAKKHEHNNSTLMNSPSRSIIFSLSMSLSFSIALLRGNNSLAHISTWISNKIIIWMDYCYHVSMVTILVMYIMILHTRQYWTYIERELWEMPNMWCDQTKPAKNQKLFF